MTAKSSPKSPDELKPEILAAVLAHVPFDGWSDAAISRAASSLGLDKAIIQLAFPGGALGFIEYFSAQADARLVEYLKDPAHHQGKIRDRITNAVRFRIEDNNAHREAARRALTLLALPQNSVAGLKMLYATVDSMWYGIGDRATDINFYTKRMILASVFSAVLLFWLSDESEGSADSWAFLDRRIGDVMKIEKFKAGLGKPLRNMPDPAEILGRFRYPRAHSHRF